MEDLKCEEDAEKDARRCPKTRRIVVQAPGRCHLDGQRQQNSGSRDPDEPAEGSRLGLRIRGGQQRHRGQQLEQAQMGGSGTHQMEDATVVSKTVNRLLTSCPPSRFLAGSTC